MKIESRIIRKLIRGSRRPENGAEVQLSAMYNGWFRSPLILKVDWSSQSPAIILSKNLGEKPGDFQSWGSKTPENLQP